VAFIDNFSDAEQAVRDAEAHVADATVSGDEQERLRATIEARRRTHRPRGLGLRRPALRKPRGRHFGLELMGPFRAQTSAAPYRAAPKTVAQLFRLRRPPLPRACTEGTDARRRLLKVRAPHVVRRRRRPSTTIVPLARSRLAAARGNGYGDPWRPVLFDTRRNPLVDDESSRERIRADDDAQKLRADARDAEADVREGIADVRKANEDMRELIGDARGAEADSREVTADAREASADAREAIADVRRANEDMREIIGDARSVKADSRELTADARQADADAREVSADERGAQADSRELTADARQADADAREVRADEREAAAEVRESAADARDAADARKPRRGQISPRE
jgi:hypothetical protein